MTELMTDLNRGAVLAGFRVEGLLGRGGMGVVYPAEQLRLKRRVALKLLAPNSPRMSASGSASCASPSSRQPRPPQRGADLRRRRGRRAALHRDALGGGTDLGTLLAQEGPLELEWTVEIVDAVAAAAAVPALRPTRGGTDDPAKPTTVITRDSIQRIDPDTNELVATIPYGQPGLKAYGAGELAVGEGAVWVIDRTTQTVNRIEVSTNSVSSSAALPIDPDTALSNIGEIDVVTAASGS